MEGLKDWQAEVADSQCFPVLLLPCNTRILHECDLHGEVGLNTWEVGLVCVHLPRNEVVIFASHWQLVCSAPFSKDNDGVSMEVLDIQRHSAR